MGVVMTNKEKKFAQKMGKTIAARRLKASLTQAELAELIGVEQETISRFERGATLPPLNRLADIADALKCPLENLLRDGSDRVEDIAQSIVVALNELPHPDDASFIHSTVMRLAERLKRRK